MVFYKFLKKVAQLFRLLVYSSYVRKNAQECKGKLYVNRRSYVTSKTILGNNVNFNGMFISGRGKVTIGDNFHSGRRCRIMTDNHNYDSGASIPYDNTYIIQDVIIGDNVWFGNDVTVLPGVSIGEGAIIQACSVVVSDIPDLAIAGGHPAKVFKYRNKMHYFELKKKKKFF